MTETAYRDYLSRQDFKWWTGSGSKTFSRKTSTGGSQTVTKIGNTVDALGAHGNGSTYTDVTLNAAITAASTNDIGIEIAPGTWTISDDVTFPSTVMVIFHPGAVLSIATGKTVTFDRPDNIIASPNHQIFTTSGTGTVAFTYAGSCYPDWWGCKGDNSTDDTTVFDNMIDDLAAGSIVHITPGKTYLASAITVDEELKFTGGGTIKQLGSGASADTPFISISADNVSFDGITVDGNSSNQGAVTGANLIEFTNSADDGEVIRCIIKNSTGSCVSGYGMSDLKIIGNRFDNWRAGNYGAIWISSTITGASAAAYRTRIEGNNVDGSTSNSSCIKVAGSSTYPAYDTVIANNQVKVGSTTSDTIGIELWSSSGIGILRATITGNSVTAENNTNEHVFGISSAGAGTYEVSITGNTVNNCRVYGIELANSLYAAISGNTVRQTNATPLAGYPGIMVNESSKNTVSGNSVVGYIYGIQLYSQNSSFANASENVITGNTVILPASTAGSAIYLQANNASAVVSRNLISSNSMIGDGTASQIGLALQLDAGTLSDTTVSTNFFYNFPVGASSDSETYTHFINNVFKTCTATIGGTAGTGQVIVGQDAVDGTYQMQLPTSNNLAITTAVQHDTAGEGAASTGFIRLKQDDYIMFRNEAGDGDVVGMYKNDANEVILGGSAGIGVTSTLYIGDAGAANVQAPAKGTGAGPTTSTTVAKFIAIDVSGTTYYIPLMQ